MQTSIENHQSTKYKRLLWYQVAPAVRRKTLGGTIPRLFYEEVCVWVVLTSMSPPPPEVRHATRG